ncbi:MAG: hypothetical protein KOO60_09790 [Gemmatimonadales bacterium]|nr:hypothetical protein [Gemmatimonadales bacterium]
MIRSHDLSLAPGGRILRVFATLLLFGLLAVPLGAALAADHSDIVELRQRAIRENWTFELDDTFIRSRTPEERANLRGYAPPPGYEKELEAHLQILPVNKAELPSSLDWRNVDGITPVKNQGSCGSCWAFAATGEMEAFIKIYYGVEVDLSEQQSISCNPYGAGCGGGWAVASYYIWQNYGGVLEDCHPYLSTDPPAAPCLEDNFFDYAHITGYRSISNDVEQIKTALQVGPVCTAIDAGYEFENYGGGCYNVPGYGTNHLVLIVGYDDRACGGAGAWIIKNSWGAGFGESGYIEVQYGAGNVGISVTQMNYTPPPVVVSVDQTFGLEDLIGDELVTLNWDTSGDPTSTVDIWMGIDGLCNDIFIAEDIPNSGSYEFSVPNMGTDYGSLVVFPSNGTQDGFGFARRYLKIVGHKIRYVSTNGSNTAPYESPATAAHSISDALVACTGTDSVYVVGGDYFGAITVTDPVRLFGGWDETFSTRDPVNNPTRLISGSGGIRFYSGSGDFGGVDGFTFKDCVGASYSDPVPGHHGGAIYTINASPRITNCIFEDNYADLGLDTGFGGAICFMGGQPVVQDCEFTGNIASNGGAVAVLDGAVATFTDCLFYGNSCSDSLSTFTGACFQVEDSTLNLTGGSLINNGGSAFGSGVWAENSTVTMNGVVIRNNRALNEGGAFHLTSSSLDLANCILENNLAGSGNGGGVFSASGDLVLHNVRMTGNHAGVMGGGLYGNNAGGVIENCLFDNNTAPSVGGLGIFSTGSLVIRNNIVMENPGGGLLVTGTEFEADYNNVWNNPDGDYFALVPGVNDLSLDPLFVDQPGGDVGLAAHSPCLDRGVDDPACLDPDGSRADIGLFGGPGAEMVAPAVVAGAAVASLGSGQFRLTWNPGAEPDLDHYVVYRDTNAVFVPSVEKVSSIVDHPTVQFEDTPPHDCYYIVVAVDTEGHSSGFSDRAWTDGAGGSPVADSLPTVLAIREIAPNPFNPMARISFDVPRTGHICLEVFDIRGRLVRELVSGSMEAGNHSVIWNGRDDRGGIAAAGVYFARMTDGTMAKTAKMVLAK